jgi:hypothetical protein
MIKRCNTKTLMPGISLQQIMLLKSFTVDCESAKNQYRQIEKNMF